MTAITFDNVRRRFLAVNERRIDRVAFPQNALAFDENRFVPYPLFYLFIATLEKSTLSVTLVVVM